MSYWRRDDEDAASRGPQRDGKRNGRCDPADRSPLEVNTSMREAARRRNASEACIQLKRPVSAINVMDQTHLAVKYSVLRIGLPALIHGH